MTKVGGFLLGRCDLSLPKRSKKTFQLVAGLYIRRTGWCRGHRVVIGRRRNSYTRENLPIGSPAEFQVRTLKCLFPIIVLLLTEYKTFTYVKSQHLFCFFFSTAVLHNNRQRNIYLYFMLIALARCPNEGK